MSDRTIFVLKRNDTLRLTERNNPQCPPLQHTLFEKLLQCEAALMDIYAQWNATAHISKLPAELLSEIFLHLLADCSNHFRLEEQRRKIMRICRFWRDVALNFPSLWTNLIVSGGRGSLQHLDTVFQRSKSKALQIYATIYHGSDHSSSCEELVSTLKGIVHRIDTLEISLWPEDLKSLVPLFSSGECPMRTLRAGTDHVYEGWSYDVVSGELFPMLRDASLDGFPGCALSSWIPRSITSLKLSKVWITYQELLDFLSNLPMLEILRISDISHSDQPVPTGPVHLPLLQHLEFTTDASDARFIRYLSVPSEASISLFISSVSWPQLNNVLTPLINDRDIDTMEIPASKLRRSSDSLQLFYWKTPQEPHFQPPRVIFSIDYMEQDVWSRIFATFGLMRGSVIKVKKDVLQPADWVRLLRCAVNLVVLHLHGRSVLSFVDGLLSQGFVMGCKTLSKLVLEEVDLGSRYNRQEFFNELGRALRVRKNKPPVVAEIVARGPSIHKWLDCSKSNLDSFKETTGLEIVFENSEE